MNSQNQDSKNNGHKPSEKDDGLQTIALLQKIKDGQFEANSIGKAERKLLVRFLMAEGKSTAEIAHLLNVSDRTIERDKKALQEENTITKDSKLAEQMAGRLDSEAKLCIERIRKFARGKDTPASVKVDAEHRCFQICNNFVERLQSLGFLPTATQKFEADLTHRAASSLTLEEIQLEAKQLQKIKESLPADVIKQADSPIEANETVTEFEDDSHKQDKKGENHDTIK